MSSKYLKALEYRIGPFLVFLTFTILYSITRMKRENIGELLKLKKEGKEVILAFWHGRQFLLIAYHRYRKIAIMTSKSRDGDLQTANIINHGYVPIRGSSGKIGAVKATLQMIDHVKRGHIGAFAVDGPSGPAFEVKHGILYIAQKTKAAILPISSSAKYRKVFNNWDKYLLPLPIPFNKASMVYGKPIEVKEGDDLEIKAKELADELNRIGVLADKLVD